MELNFFDFLEKPNLDIWLINEINNKIKNLKIIVENKETISFIEFFDNISIDQFSQLHNNIVEDFKISLVLAESYISKGIPDDNWWSNSENHIKYFSDFKEENFMYKLWFDYFIANSYTKIFTIWDSIYRFINTYYKLNIDEEFGFKDKIKKAIKNNSEIITILQDIEKSNSYKTANKYRIDIVHGVPPTEIKNRVRCEMEGRKVKKYSFGAGEYITSKECLNTLIDFLDLLSNNYPKLVDKILNSPKEPSNAHPNP